MNNFLKSIFSNLLNKHKKLSNPEPLSLEISSDLMPENDTVSPTLEVGKKYSLEALDALFDFDYKKPSGIKQTKHGDVVLFLNNTQVYQDKEIDGLIYFQGQNTGGGTQKLIYGNKLLYDAYTSPTTKIYLFKSYVYSGEYVICKKPYIEGEKWVFPIAGR